EYDQKNLLYVRIDRKRKFLGTVFLRALGLKTNADILQSFYAVDKITVTGAALSRRVSENLIGMRLSDDVKDAKGGVIVKKGRKITNLVLRELQKNEIETLSASPEDFEGALFAADV